MEADGPLEAAPFPFDLLLEHQNGVEKLFGTRRATGNVDIDRNDLIDALDDCVVVENPT